MGKVKQDLVKDIANACLLQIAEKTPYSLIELVHLYRRCRSLDRVISIVKYCLEQGTSINKACVIHDL